MIHSTEAVVLRSIPYGETSLIVTLFTRAKGKVTVIAKGARVPKSRFGSSLQPLSYAHVVFYHRPGRGVQTLSESSLMEPLINIQRDIRRLSVGIRAVELVSALMEEEEENVLMFNLLLQVLHYLNEPIRFPENVLSYFQLRMAGALGFAPHIDREAVTEVGEAGGQISLSTGSVVAAGSDASRTASRAAIRAFAIFARAELDVVVRLDLPTDVRREIDRLIEEFMRYHVEEAYPSRSHRVLGQLQDVGKPVKKDPERGKD